MAWDNTEPAAIRHARLSVMPPVEVYEELQGFDATSVSTVFFAERDLEFMLLARNDLLIDLALAKYGAVDDIVANLYRRGAEQLASDPVYGKGLQFACLANQNVSLGAHGKFFGHCNGVSVDELRRLVLDTNQEAITTLLSNPTADPVLQALFNQLPPFNDLEPDLLCVLVHYASDNPAINHGRSGQHGTDSTLPSIDAGIVELLKTSPVSENWLITLTLLLASMNPRYPYTPDLELGPVLAKWRNSTGTQTPGNLLTDTGGEHTSLNRVEEFLCMLASLYGCRENGLLIQATGGSDDPDVVMRCAFYGRATNLTIEQMQTAFERDADVFVLAALQNNAVFSQKDLRAALEGMLNNEYARATFTKRMEHAKTRWPLVNAGLAERPSPSVTSEGAVLTALSRVEASIAKLTSSANRLASVAKWGFAILVVLILLHH
ncbi:MAG: hypothetical protein PHR30_13295 [Gallionellaceae bacterium]|nr:hypothetical protein [Gallionellaceae bacterium]